MSLLHLVEEHDLVRPAPNRFRKRAPVVVSDVAGRRADQPRNRVPLHELRHVESHKRGFIVEQELRKRFCQFGLADAGGAKEQERPQRPVGIVETGPGSPNRVRHRLHRNILRDDPVAELRFHLDEPFALALEHL